MAAVTLFHVGNCGTAAQSGNITPTFSVSKTAVGGSVGDVLIVTIASDNTTSAASADTSEITGITDSAGNTYTLVGAHRTSTATVGDGVVAEIWLTRVTTAIPTGTITISYTGSPGSKAVSVNCFSGFTTTPYVAQVNVGGVLNSTTFPTASTSGLPAGEYVTVRINGREINSTNPLTITSLWTGLNGTAPISANNTGQISGMELMGEFICDSLTTGATSTLSASTTTSTDLAYVIASISNGRTNSSLAGFVGTF